MARCVKCQELVSDCKCKFRTEYKGVATKAKTTKAKVTKPKTAKVEK